MKPRKKKKEKNDKTEKKIKQNRNIYLKKQYKWQNLYNKIAKTESTSIGFQSKFKRKLFFKPNL